MRAAVPLGLPVAGPGGRRHLGLRRGFESPDLDTPGRQLHRQGLCEARLGYRDGLPNWGLRDPS